MHAYARTTRKRARARKKRVCTRKNKRTRVYASCRRVCAQIILKFFVVVTNNLMSLSLKFHKDPSFCFRDNRLFVTLYD